MFLGEFSIYGDRAAQCLAKTWLGRGNKKEKKKRKRVCSSSLSMVVTPALPRVCARAFSSPRDRGCRVASGSGMPQRCGDPKSPSSAFPLCWVKE